jgi:hypothetical protein
MRQDHATLRKRYTRIRRMDGEFVAVLTVGCQSFTVMPVKSRRGAEWMRDMLAKALARLVEKEKKGGKA